MFCSYLLVKPLDALTYRHVELGYSRLKQISILLLVVLSIAPILPQAMMEYSDMYDQHITSFSKDEYMMSQWISDVSTPESIIISEPITQIIFEALCNRRSIDGNYLSGDRANLIKTAISSSRERDSASGFDIQICTIDKNGYKQIQ